ncbi:MAG: hypothetical protein N2Z65_05385 [Clostridiales bacterium]|nr:hypothetical protein [Clostridiales bacterium]
MERLSAILGFAGNESVLKLLHDVSEYDLPSVLSNLSDLYASGINITSLFDELTLMLRDLLIIKLSPKNSSSLLSPSHEYSELAPIAEHFTKEKLIWIYNTVEETLIRMQRSRARMIDAEMCLIKLCSKEEPETAPFAYNAPKAVPVMKSSPPKMAEQKNIPDPPKEIKKPMSPAKTEPNVKQNPGAPAFDWNLLVSKLAGKVPPSVFAHLNLADAVFENQKIKILVEPEAIDHLNNIKIKSTISSVAKELYSVDYTVDVTTPDSVTSNDPCMELIRNARLGGVELEIK